MPRLTRIIKNNLEYLFSCKAKVKKKANKIIVSMRYADRETLSVVELRRDIKLKFNQTVKVTVYGTEDHVYNKKTGRIVLKNPVDHDLLIPIIQNRMLKTFFRPGYYLIPANKEYYDKYKSSPCVIIAVDIIQRW